MCGRFTLGSDPQTLQDVFDLAETSLLPPRYNIAPSEAVTAIRVREPDEGRRLALLRWGLVPSWAKEAKVGARMINARAETVATNNAFRTAFRRRRCLIPADGFYEWQQTGRGKQPFYMRMRDGLPFAFAGLWEFWKGADGEGLETCTIITTQPSKLVAPIHDRMPVILDPSDYDLWLDPGMGDEQRLQSLLRPYPDERMVAYPVSTLVNNPANDDPACIAPLPGAATSDNGRPTSDDRPPMPDGRPTTSA
jgi:putative SOS response-associated peptidase YedK